MQYLIYIFAIIVLNAGLFIMLTSDNYVRKIIGLGVFQSSVLIFYIALGKTRDGIVPIDICQNTLTCPHIYSSPIPHVLMLTAIVVGFATMSVGLALIYQIKREYGTVSESEIDQRNIRPLAELTSARPVAGAYGAEDRSVLGVRDSLSTEATTQSPAEVEFRKRSIL